jgi:hypothetical protein
MCRFRSLAVAFSAFTVVACGGTESESPKENTANSGGNSAVTSPSTGGSSGTTNATSARRTSPTTGGSTGVGGTIGTAGTDSTAPRGGTFPGTGGTNTTTTTTPQECQGTVPASITLPQVIRFQITNQTSSAAFVGGGSTCSLIPKIESCADSYQKAIATTAGCAVNCASTVSGCIACGACLAQATELSPNASTNIEWAGLVYTYSQIPNLGCTCYNASIAPVGKYRATISLYSTKDIPYDGTGITRTVSVDFNYPDDDGIVEFNL